MAYATGAAIAAAMLLFIWIGLRARSANPDLDQYLTARNSQGALTLGLSFLASGMGAWILFAPPEVGAFVGPIALAGYAVGAALPFLILAWCGPMIRARLPKGRSITDYAQDRYGSALRHWVSILSVLYMLFFLTAELTAIGAITEMLSDVPGESVVIGLAITTLIYTAWGGLRASLATDRWQAWLLLALLLIVATVAIPALPDLPEGRFEQNLPAVPLGVSLSVALTLVIAVTTANLMHQGYWQRVWAAESNQALQRGAWIGAGSTVLVVMGIGGLGILAVASGLNLGSPPIPFFALLAEAPAWLALPALLLALALVASSVDTLQNAIASLLATGPRPVTLSTARWLTVLLMVPVVLVALQGFSVLRLFLIADLLCATAVVPVLLGLWKRMTTRAAWAGCVAGVMGAIVPGWVQTGSLTGGILAASFPDSIPTLAPFLGALIASTAVSLIVVATHTRHPTQPRK